ncbi:hypothetical protein [Nonlabens sp. Hel1_33_55]|uniref:hypothetical protein n=1 Tax=Nonlabens sp. Hel1_33_55 TaxID=1336802 RepID=UPI000B83C208|nr:hypothetical protein [Nonlabens sp. Hel1_33_55]
MARNLAFAIIILINCLFSFKYLERYTDHYLGLTILYLFVQVFLIVLYKRIEKRKLIQVSLLSGLILIPILIAIYSFIYIDPMELNVDRWSVIDSFWNQLLSGRYPYYAVSHMGNIPGPMPFYYLVALPFYLTNTYSFLSAIGCLVFIFFLFKELNLSLIPISVIISIFSLVTFYEIVVLSNLFTFSVLVAIALFYFEKRFRKESKGILINAIILGLLLATRSVYSLAYVVFFISFLKTRMINVRQAAAYSAIILTSFVLTFVPLLLFYFDDFFKMNPFIVQSSFLLPASLIPLLFIIAVIFGFLAKTTWQRFLYSGFTIFLSILIYAIYLISQYGFLEALYQSKIDISYFIFSIPFLLIGKLTFTKKINIDQIANSGYATGSFHNLQLSKPQQ